MAVKTDKPDCTECKTNRWVHRAYGRWQGGWDDIWVCGQCRSGAIKNVEGHLH